jgi:hypothetical protein
MIEYYRALGISANKINGVGPGNRNRDTYLDAALGEFGAP